MHSGLVWLSAKAVGCGMVKIENTTSSPTIDNTQGKISSSLKNEVHEVVVAVVVVVVAGRTSDCLINQSEVLFFVINLE